MTNFDDKLFQQRPRETGLALKFRHDAHPRFQASFERVAHLKKKRRPGNKVASFFEKFLSRQHTVVTTRGTNFDDKLFQQRPLETGLALNLEPRFSS